MNKKLVVKKFIADAASSSSPEAFEVRKILSRMIRSEIRWAEEHKGEAVCSKCGKNNVETSAFK